MPMFAKVHDESREYSEIGSPSSGLIDGKTAQGGICGTYSEICIHILVVGKLKTDTENTIEHFPERSPVTCAEVSDYSFVYTADIEKGFSIRNQAMPPIPIEFPINAHKKSCFNGVVNFRHP